MTEDQQDKLGRENNEAGLGESWSDRQRKEGAALRDEDGRLRLPLSAAIPAPPEPANE